MCNWKYYTPKEISVVFHNRPNYDYHFIIKNPVKEFSWEELFCLKKDLIVFSSNKNLVKEEKKLGQSSYPTNYNLLIVWNLLQVYYQILLIILVKKFIKLNVNMNMIMKNVQNRETKTTITSTILNM